LATSQRIYEKLRFISNRLHYAGWLDFFVFFTTTSIYYIGHKKNLQTASWGKLVGWR
jgi:hypothetical protein